MLNVYNDLMKHLLGLHIRCIHVKGLYHNKTHVNILV